MTATPMVSTRSRAWPRLVAGGGAGFVAGAVTLGLAPPSDPAWAVASVILLAAVGALPAALRTGLGGLAAAWIGLLGGLAATTWPRIWLAESGLGGFRSLQPVAEWRVAYAAFVGAGLVAVGLGYLVGAGLLGRRGGSGRRDGSGRRAAMLLAGGLAGSIVLAGALAMALGTTALVIPEGAVILRVTVTDGMILLEPPAVPAGEIHFIRSQRGRRYDGPFMVSGTGPQGIAGRISHGPLTDADVAGLQEGRLPDGSTVAEVYAGVPPGEPAPWPAPEEYGGHESLAPGRYAWWTLEVDDATGRAGMKDLVFFTVP